MNKFKELRKILIDLEFNQTEFAKELGLSTSMVSAIFLGKRKISKELEIKIINFLRDKSVSEDKIYNFTKEVLLVNKKIRLEDLPDYENEEDKFKHFNLISKLVGARLNDNQIKILEEELKKIEQFNK